MAGTNAVQCKRRVVDALTSMADLPGSALASNPDAGTLGVQVSYHYPGASPQRELIYAGGITGEQAQAAMRAGGRVPRIEDAVLMLHIEVSRPGAAPYETELRAEEIAAVVVEWLADDPSMNQQGDLLFGGVDSTDMEPAAVDDDGTKATLVLGIALKSWLT